MKVTEIEMHAGDVDHPYRTVGEISAKVEAATLFPKTPTLEDINFKLPGGGFATGSKRGHQSGIQARHVAGEWCGCCLRV